MYLQAYEFFQMECPIGKKNFFETEQNKQLYQDLKYLIRFGGIFAITGIVGAGKTTILNRFQELFEKDRDIIVSRSLSTEQKRLTVGNLFTALFYDISKNEKNIKVPSVSEKRERELILLIKKYKKPVVLVIDEAHDIHGKTLIALKRIVELVAQSGYHLAILMGGHPKLYNSLSMTTMEEVGARTKKFNIDYAIADRSRFINWWIKQYAKKGTKSDDIISKDAVDLLAEKLQTPLQIESYLTQAIEYGYRINEKPINVDIVNSLLHPALSSLEAQLARNGYQLNNICELLQATPKEVRSFFDGKPNHPRKQEFLIKIKAVGVNPSELFHSKIEQK